MYFSQDAWKEGMLRADELRTSGMKQAWQCRQEPMDVMAEENFQKTFSPAKAGSAFCVHINQSIKNES